MIVNWNVPLDDERNLSIDQFRLAEDLTIEQWNDLMQAGLAPKTDDFLYPLHTRITAKARREWHERMAIELERATKEVEDHLRETAQQRS
jgi:hypothetical protein